MSLYAQMDSSRSQILYYPPSKLRQSGESGCWIGTEVATYKSMVALQQTFPSPEHSCSF
jgi:hypothetical protein